MKKKLSVRFRLYGILDYAALNGRSIISAAEKAISGGIDVIQLRFKPADSFGRETELSRVIKDACRISRLTRRSSSVFLINDRVDIALLANADGVHLGQGDMPVFFARKLLGKDKIIGVSCHSLKQSLAAQKQGADYVSIGPIFKTPTKPEYKAVGLSLIRKAKDRLKIPFVAIGGINLNNIKKVLTAGAQRIAVVRAVCGAKNIQDAVKDFNLKLGKQQLLS